ncbi:hypothetical protein CEXT_507711, partial [Caerostris extrusa]
LISRDVSNQWSEGAVLRRRPIELRHSWKAGLFKERRKCNRGKKLWELGHRCSRIVFRLWIINAVE